jgi:gliding motility-associated-like protein
MSMNQNLIRAALILVVSLAAVVPSSAQFFIMGNETVETCAGIFVDAGNSDDGTGNPYPDANFTYTICPDNPGDAVSVSFVAFGLQTNPNPNNSDYLFIYDGPDAGSPSMGNYTGNALQGLPVTATVNNPTGCLTFVFQDNGPGNDLAPGWEANISCTTPCATPTSASSIIDPPLPNPDSLSIGVCLNQEITFGDAGSVAGAPEFNLENWIWNFDDGTIDTLTNSGNVTHSFDEPGEYIVNLSVLDNNGCVSLNLQPLQVLVSTIPLFNSFQSTPVCAGSPAFVDGNPVQSVTWTALPPQVVAGETYLADGAGFSYTSELNFDFFEDGATLDDCDDLLSVTVNMEHSYMGDLDLTITCPDGTTVPLMSYPNGGGGCFLGEAVDDGSNIPGTGYDYGWSPNPDIATNINDNSNWTQTTYTDNAGNAENNNIANPGIYTPEGDLCDFVGCPLNGTWTFSVVDNLAIDNGYIFEWGLNLNPALIPGVTTFTPTIGLNADSSYWTGPGIINQDFDANYCDIILDEPGIYDYTFTVTNNFSCTFDTTLSIEVVEGPENSITAGPDQVFCGDPVQLQGAFVGGGPSPCGASQGTTTYCYGNNENTEWVYCPDTPGDGTFMNILFYDGAIENFFDHIQVFDGDNTGAPLLVDLTGNYPETSVTATNPDGCLTVLFTSDGSVSCDASTFYEEVSWCVGCGLDACGFTWNWEPADNLTDPNSSQPTVNTFDGTPTEYVAFVEPIGLENCATTDTVLVIPGFEYTTDYSDPTCLITDGTITLNISEPASEGPWDVQLSMAAGVINQQSFGGGLLVFEDLEAGNYDLEVSDQSGCSYTSEFDLADPEPPAITVSDDDQICIGGTAVLTAEAASGGPYGFNWTVNGDPVGQGASILVSPTGTTTYDVQGVDGAGCVTQPGSVTVGIYDGFTVDITAEDLICLGDEVLLSAIDVTGGEGNGYSFDFAYDGVTFAAGEEDEVGFVPPLTGEFCVTVSEACTTPPVTACMEVEVEQPYDLTLAADTTRGCVPEAIPFSHSIPSAFVQSQGWDFGDGGQSVEATPVHIFDEPGVYDIALSVITTTGCVNTTIADNYIQVYTPPSVGFDAGPQPTTAPDTRIDFESSVSPNVVEWNWTFIFGVVDAVSNEPDPTYTFPMGQGGIYPVTLAVVDTNGCESQVTRNVEIFDFFNVFIPNAFTPNNDGFNDLWAVYGTDIDPDRFEMSVFNRWGEEVFHTTDLDEGWVGQSDDDKLDPGTWYYSMDGVYAYRIVLYSESTNEKREVKGFINLTR